MRDMCGCLQFFASRQSWKWMDLLFMPLWFSALLTRVCILVTTGRHVGLDRGARCRAGAVADVSSRWGCVRTVAEDQGPPTAWPLSEGVRRQHWWQSGSSHRSPTGRAASRVLPGGWAGSTDGSSAVRCSESMDGDRADSTDDSEEAAGGAAAYKWMWRYTGGAGFSGIEEAVLSAAHAS